MDLIVKFLTVIAWIGTVGGGLLALLNLILHWNYYESVDQKLDHLRGNDINQNAIVGTFLRTLEYYTGILFMTSNMETAIDDAIMSRATAHLIYEAPSKEDQVKIWNVLINQFEVKELTNKDVIKIVDKYPNLVGRDIKALLKLAVMYSKGKNEKIAITTIDKIHGFIPNVSKKIN